MTRILIWLKLFLKKKKEKETNQNFLDALLAVQEVLTTTIQYVRLYP